MDDRFPRWLRTVVRKLDFIGIPNLGGLLCGMAVLAFIADYINPVMMDRFLFRPELVLQGEWWRLLSFPFNGGSESVWSPIWLLFYCLYVYFVVATLESAWGPGPVTVFVVLGYVSTLIGSFITGLPVNISSMILENVSLAFGTLFPYYELMLYFIIPVKAKWLAMLAGLMILLQFIGSGTAGKLLIFCSFFPYLLFFSPLLVHQIKSQIRIRKNRRRFDDDMWR